jgi:hypothetical protein
MAARVTQVTTEVLVQPAGQRARVTQLVADALAQPTTQRARVTQLAVEALYDAGLPPAPTAVGRSFVVIAG